MLDDARVLVATFIGMSARGARYRNVEPCAWVESTERWRVRECYARDDMKISWKISSVYGKIADNYYLYGSSNRNKMFSAEPYMQPKRNWGPSISTHFSVNRDLIRHCAVIWPSSSPAQKCTSFHCPEISQACWASSDPKYRIHAASNHNTWRLRKAVR